MYVYVLQKYMPPDNQSRSQAFLDKPSVYSVVCHSYSDYKLYMYIPMFAVKMHEMTMDIPIFWVPLMVPHGATMAGADPLRSPLLAPGEPTTRAAANTSCGRPNRRPNRAAWPGLPGLPGLKVCQRDRCDAPEMVIPFIP